MEIVEVPNNKDKRFEDICVCSAFIYNNKLYLKITNDLVEGNSICFENSMIRSAHFGKNDLVTFVKIIRIEFMKG